VARLHDDEAHVDADLVRKLLADQLPAQASLSVRRVATGGTDNAVFRLGDELTARLPLHPGAADGLLKEIRWLPVLAPHLTLPVPELVAVGREAAGYPFRWAVVRWLPGTDALAGRIDSPADTATQLGRFVAELQQAPTEGAPRQGTDGFARGGPLMDRDETFRGALARCEGLIDVPAAREVWEDALGAPEWQGRAVWLHADLIPGNLLLRDGRLAGVLDFGALSVGDPAYDATPAWFVLDRQSRPIFRDAVGADDATWRRARGLVVSQAVIALPYYIDSHPGMVATAIRGLDQALEDR
jgi:aminoglycoside phosphotransferase (APT) family kinase protein